MSAFFFHPFSFSLSLSHLEKKAKSFSPLSLSLSLTHGHHGSERLEHLDERDGQVEVHDVAKVQSEGHQKSHWSFFFFLNFRECEFEVVLFSPSSVLLLSLSLFRPSLPPPPPPHNNSSHSPGTTLVRYSLAENAFLLASTMLVTLQQKKAAADEKSMPRHESAIG